LRKDFPLAGKPTELPGVVFTRVTPMEGGPFVTSAGGKDAIDREPRVQTPEGAEPGISDKRRHQL
jgi:NADH-quinone oxidoreductase subunit C